MSDVTPPEGLPDQPPATPPPVPAASSQPPPPPPPPGYGAPPPTPSDEPFSVGAAFSWGWAKFQLNVGPILIAVLVYLAIVVVVEIVAFVILGGLFFSTASLEYNETTQQFTTTGGTSFLAMMFVYALTILVFTVLFAFLQASVIRGGLMIARGQRLELGHMFNFENFGTILVAAIIVGVLTAVGYLFCFVGSLVVAFFTPFYLFFVIDKRLGAWESVMASFNLVKENVGQVLLLLLGVWLAFVVGSILCGIGLLVTAPVALLALTYGYLRLQNEPVAA